MAEAVSHIRQHGSGHTEGIAAADARVIDEFCRRVDAAAIVVNGSLRLHDGPTMRLGPEVSISTGRLHVRGPVGLGSLLTYTWVIDGNGTLRTQLSDDAVLTTPSW
jgi:glutamate-5-semialdehyde dehydrogenase